jgi:hypothetical protein
MQSDSNKSFLLGAGVMLAGFAANSFIRSFTIDNARNLILLAEEVRSLVTGVPSKPVVTLPPPASEDDEPDIEYPNYDPGFDREYPPAPPSVDNFKPSRPVAIDLTDDEDFFDKINEEASKGESLVEDWMLA